MRVDYLTYLVIVSYTQVQQVPNGMFPIKGIMTFFFSNLKKKTCLIHSLRQCLFQVTDYCPQQCLEWLSQQVTRNKLAHTWVLQNMEMWVEMYLMAHHNIRVRNAAAMLLVALVPNPNFRQGFRTSRSFFSPQKEAPVS